jgi:serine acetyltransferase
MFENIGYDMKRTLLHQGKISSTINVLRLLWKNEGFQVLIIYRFGRWLGRVSKCRYGWSIVATLFPIYWILSVCARKAYDIDLDQSADIAPGAYIAHLGGIKVRNCRIGSSCYLGQQIKLKSAKANGKGLTIGESVYIGAHAQICANLTIGDSATIGAGAVVTQDIPHHCLVLGNPGRIVQQNYDNHSFL